MGDIINLNGVENKDRLLSPIFLNLLVSLILSCVPIIDKHEGTFLSVRLLTCLISHCQLKSTIINNTLLEVNLGVQNYCILFMSRNISAAVTVVRAVREKQTCISHQQVSSYHNVTFLGRAYRMNPKCNKVMGLKTTTHWNN